MSKVYDIKENIMMLADYNDPEPHKHLASHIIISLDGNMNWQVEDEEMTCRGICINSETVHTGQMSNKGALVFIFTTTSGYGQSLDKVYLKGKKYYILNEKIVDEVCEKYKEISTERERIKGVFGTGNADIYECKNADSNDRVNISKSINEGAVSDEDFFDMLMGICGLNKNDACSYDHRIIEILSYVRKQKTIESSIIDELSRLVFLSKSRISHIFKDETKMTLHSYLALEKLRKASEYIDEGMSITEASLNAGFDSPSHCAATCKRMFGISLRDVYKTIK